MREFTEEDFAKAIKNPFFHKLNKEVTVAVRNEDYELFEKLSNENGVPIDKLLNRCIIYYAQMLREDED
jgi:hypothetical protein